MSWATVTSKGQITIPAEVRRRLGLKRGSRVRFVQVADGVYEIAPANASVTQLRGAVPNPAEPVTLEQMEAAVAESAVRSATTEPPA